MKIGDLIEEIYYALTSNIIRSGLTALGIVIGIGSVISMVAIGQGSQNTIQDKVESLGSNLLIVTPGVQRGVGMQVSSGRGSAQTLTNDDFEAIKNQISGIDGVEPEVSSRKQVTAKGTNTNVSIVGTTADYLSVRKTEIESGIFLTAANEQAKSKVAVIGSTVRDDLFGEDAEENDVIGKTIKINKISFKVIGLTKEKGGSTMNSQDNMIFIPLSTAQQLLTGNDKLNSIYVQASDQKLMAEVQTAITDLLLVQHKISDSTAADFTVTNQEDISSAASSVANTFTLLLGSVAAISLVVGGIGIMNMMLTTVTERTREIGLRKALGATKKEISRQFLGESIALTFIGGFLGVVLGFLAALAMKYFGSINAAVSLSSVLLAFGVSSAIGIIFGYYPAKRAASLNPIEALRYE